MSSASIFVTLQSLINLIEYVIRLIDLTHRPNLRYEMKHTDIIIYFHITYQILQGNSHNSTDNWI